MIFGLGAAVAWGFGDLGAAIVGRRIGSVATTIGGQLSATAALYVIFLVSGTPFDVPAEELWLLIGNGVLVAWAYLLLYRGLELGPVALVSPIVSANSVVAILLAVVLLDEVLTGLALAGACLTVLGVMLTTTDLRRLRRATLLDAGPGIRLALASMAVFGVAAFLLGRSAQEVGFLPTLIGTRSSSAVVLLLLAWRRRRDLRLAGGRLVEAAGVGLLDLIGTALFARGSEVGLVSVTSAVAATFTLIPAGGGIVLFRERPVPNQFVGIALVILGLVLLGATS